MAFPALLLPPFLFPRPMHESVGEHAQPNMDELSRGSSLGLVLALRLRKRGNCDAVAVGEDFVFFPLVGFPQSESLDELEESLSWPSSSLSFAWSWNRMFRKFRGRNVEDPDLSTALMEAIFVFATSWER